MKLTLPAMRLLLVAILVGLCGCVPAANEQSTSSEQDLRNEIATLSAKCKAGDKEACKATSTAKRQLQKIAGCHCAGKQPKGHPPVN